MSAIVPRQFDLEDGVLPCELAHRVSIAIKSKDLKRTSLHSENPIEQGKIPMSRSMTEVYKGIKEHSRASEGR